MKHSQVHDVIFVIAIFATALALGGALAHSFEFLNKIDLPKEEYFIVQKIYSGWNQLAYPIAAQLLSMVVLAFMSSNAPQVMWPILAAIVFLLCSQAIFWIYTYPANVTTWNWTAIPENWHELRTQWEYSHAAGAVFQLLVLGSLAIALARQAK